MSQENIFFATTPVCLVNRGLKKVCRGKTQQSTTSPVKAIDVQAVV